MPPRPESPVPVLTAAVIRLLGERPRGIEELAEALADEGMELGPDPVGYVEDLFDEAEELHRVGALVDGERLFWAPAVLSGAVFTHAVGGPEVAHDLLLATPDLLPLGPLLPLGGDPVPLADGSPVRSVMVGLNDDVLERRGVPSGLVAPDAWLLEPGWFHRAGISAGDTVVVGIEDGRIRIERHGDAGFDDAAATRVMTLVHDLALDADADGAHEIDALIASACVVDPTAFARPVPPLGGLLQRSGFTVQGDYLCPPGVDLAARHRAARMQRVGTVHRIGQEDAWAVVTLADRVAQALGQPDAADTGVRDALDRLVRPGVAAAVAAEVLGLGDENAPALERAAEQLEPLAPRRSRHAVRWLRAKAQERAGRVMEAERTLDAAYSLDPQFPPVLLDLARIANDRGDAERAILLLQRAGVDPDDDELTYLQGYRAPDRADLARNDPCWCGSGRRYKACHRGRERLDLPARAGWLYRKAFLHMMDGTGRRVLMDVAEARAADDQSRSLLEAMRNDLVIDLALFEGGVFADFLAARGELLPDDERLLAEQWLLVERSVHEVESVRRDRGFTARDIRTGDRHEVSERLATRQLAPGDLLLVRLVPDGRDTVIFGGIERIDLARRDMLVSLLDSEPDPVELAEFVAALHAPPTLINADGGELVVCTARLRLPDPDAVADWLDQRLTRAEDEADARTWRQQVDTPGGASIRATVRLDGDELGITTMSEDRFDALLDQLIAERPEVELVEERRSRMDDIDESDLPPAGSSAVLDPRDAGPELASALAEYVRGYEERWLDEPIPALGGVTPREAAADPTRRDDLVRLLDSFPDDDGDPGQMSAARLRADLGLS